MFVTRTQISREVPKGPIRKTPVAISSSIPMIHLRVVVKRFKFVLTGSTSSPSSRWHPKVIKRRRYVGLFFFFTIRTIRSQTERELNRGETINKSFKMLGTRKNS